MTNHDYLGDGTVGQYLEPSRLRIERDANCASRKLSKPYSIPKTITRREALEFLCTLLAGAAVVGIEKLTDVTPAPEDSVASGFKLPTIEDQIQHITNENSTTYNKQAAWKAYNAKDFKIYNGLKQYAFLINQSAANHEIPVEILAGIVANESLDYLHLPPGEIHGPNKEDGDLGICQLTLDAVEEYNRINRTKFGHKQVGENPQSSLEVAAFLLNHYKEMDPEKEQSWARAAMRYTRGPGVLDNTNTEEYMFALEYADKLRMHSEKIRLSEVMSIPK